MVDVVDKSSVIEDEERRAQGSTRRISLWAALAVVIVVLGAPALFRPHALQKLSFDQQMLNAVNDLKPDYVFIGNSMLHTRIDVGVLEQRIGARCCILLWTGGAESAWMHQALKNVALAAEHRPKTVFLFFRDTYLTQPGYRATDRYWWKIERLSHADEPALTRAMSRSRSWQDQLEFDLGEVYPLQKARDRASAIVSWTAGEIVAPGSAPFGVSGGSRYDALFDLDKMRSVEADDTAFEEEDLSEYNFASRLENSLLPSMIHLAKAAGVQLVFIRVQRRPTALGPPPQRAELRAYVSALHAYIVANGAQFYDFTGDPELTLDHYNDGDHISAAWRPESTDLFLRRVGQYFR